VGVEGWKYLSWSSRITLSSFFLCLSLHSLSTERR
jgi:hypothetical protein